MTAKEREIRRKRRILDHAVKSGNIAKTCRYFGVPRSLFYVWRTAKALNQGHRTGLSCSWSKTRFVGQVRSDSAVDDAQYKTADFRYVNEIKKGPSGGAFLKCHIRGFQAI